MRQCCFCIIFNCSVVCIFTSTINQIFDVKTKYRKGENMDVTDIFNIGDIVHFEVNCREGVVTRSGIVISFCNDFYVVKTAHGNIVRLCKEEICV